MNRVRLTSSRRWAAALVAGLFAFLPLVSYAAAPAEQTTGVPVDRQGYVVDAPADPYTNDKTAIHVGATAGKEYARSFVHLALDYLPAKALVGAASLTLKVTQSGDASSNGVYQTYNVRQDSTDVVLQACVLTSELPPTIDATHPAPGYDCAHGSAVGVGQRDTDGHVTEWAFDFKNLIKAWSAAGNTGAAILPVPNGAASNWAVSFSKAFSSSHVTYRLPPVPAPPSNDKPTTTYYRVPATVSHPYPFPTVAPSAPPSVAPAPAPQAEAPPPRTIPGVRSHAWMWVLPTCIALAALLMALSHRPVLASGGSPYRRRLASDLRLHPRAYAVASIVTVWGLLFASYSVVVAPPARIEVAGPATSIGDVLGSASSTPGASGAKGKTDARGSGGSTLARRTTGGGVAPGSEFQGPGTYRVIGNTNVFFPANGGPPAAQLYTGQDDVTGIDFVNKRVKLCGHAALTFGPAFNVSAQDISVFWDYVNANGGINGFKFDVNWIDDGYDPGKAVAGAQSCKDAGAFEILGGIGFDQIPAVRQWAEANKQLYVHHVVTTAGSDGLRYSFTALPSEEQLGVWAGQYAISHFRGKRVGILWRESPNWQSGHDLFKKVVSECGCMTIVGDHAVQKNQANYTTELATLKNTERADVIFAWENALASTEMLQQSQDQDYHPDWILFPFNLELWTLDNPPGTFRDWNKLHGIAAWDAYDPDHHSAAFSAYEKRMEEFEAQYAWANNGGPQNAKGNDLLFLTWEGFAGLADFFGRCLPDCTRNRMAGLMLTYHQKVPGFCDVDFTRKDGHHGGWVGNSFETFRAADGHLAWKPAERCAEAI